ncbi:unnamed protein product [Spirodela intermedia]|uniref:VOC domain-containing protein n=1 Tax=Spirodela intermedia TaxID=51605 RepID=A0A7I8K479_SPIIN|nr:unnamed protein product [Spirodela intermedia]
MGFEEEASTGTSADPLPLLSLNHVSFTCENVERSCEFYRRVLGFVLVRRPSSFDFRGAWLFNYGIGIHLIERSSSPDAPAKPSLIDPKANHISFQCTDVKLVRTKLEEMSIDHVVAAVSAEDGVEVGQLFFHDPDGNMVEICDCQKLPVLPVSPPASPMGLHLVGNGSGAATVSSSFCRRASLAPPLYRWHLLKKHVMKNVILQ